MPIVCQFLRASSLLEVAFKDEDGAPVTPETAFYKIDEGDDGNVILAETAIGSLDSTVVLAITAAQNTCLTTRKLENRTVTITFAYNTATAVGVVSYQYELRNLPFA